VSVNIAAILGASIGQYSLQTQAISLKKWNNFIAQQISCNNCIFMSIKFCKGDFTVSILVSLKNSFLMICHPELVFRVSTVSKGDSETSSE